MKIVSIEPTPSPNTMKINLDSELPLGTTHNYKKENSEGAPALIQEILKIEGIKGVYHVADFLALERNAKFDWKELLPNVRKAFGDTVADMESAQEQPSDRYGEINVQVQMFKDIPLQVKLSDGSSEKRFGMPEAFLKAREQAQLEEDNYILLRKWQDFGVRYGEFDQIGHEVVEELMAAYPADRLSSLVKMAQERQTISETKTKRNRLKLSLDDLDHPDWRVRYHRLEQMA
ncbi:MAG: virulence factor, partial [Bacillota bacterium]|nr:virulence factor [Bacillota bacterium]